MATGGFDTSRFSAGVAREIAKIKLDARREIHEVGAEAADTAQQMAPKGTGAMAASIKSTDGFDTSGPFTDVTVDPFYATFVEFGTSKMGARPFMGPAVRSAIRRIRRRA